AGGTAQGWRAPAQVSKTRCQDFGAAGLPPTFSQVPLATYFHETGSLSTVLCPAHACLPAAQSFCPALAMPKHLSLLASGGTGAAETDAARPSASKPATAACIVVCCFINVSLVNENELNDTDPKAGRNGSGHSVAAGSAGRPPPACGPLPGLAADAAT